MVNQGGVIIPEGIESQLSDDEHEEVGMIAKISSLTPTQLRVYILLSPGLMNKQIAANMLISEATVKAHVTSVYKKPGARSRTQAVMVANALDKALVSID